jgi:shikimate kinase
MRDGARHLVLVGLMGAGKSTVGRACAQRLTRDFVDTDDVVERLAQMSVPELFDTAGEQAFRALEREAVVDVCSSPAPLVIGCGGGTVVDPDNRATLAAHGFVVWLQAGVDALAERVDGGRDRPLLRGDSRGALTRLLALREGAYEAVADVAITTEERGIDDVAAAVLDAYSEVVP